jgi:hypothetical protein
MGQTVRLGSDAARQSIGGATRLVIISVFVGNTAALWRATKSVVEKIRHHQDPMHIGKHHLFIWRLAMRLSTRVIAPAFTILSAVSSFSILSTTQAISGGAPYQVACPNGMVMSGLEGRGGWWIDHFSLLCNNLSNIERQVGGVGYSTGGSYSRAVCPALSGVVAMEFDYTDSGGGVLVVNKIRLTCEGFTHESVNYHPVFGQDDNGSGDSVYSFSCSGSGYVAGLNGNAWLFIDSIDGVGCRRHLGEN